MKMKEGTLVATMSLNYTLKSQICQFVYISETNVKIDFCLHGDGPGGGKQLRSKAAPERTSHLNC